MGLCRCQKRRVTNLFCFVHQVNVCEDCMINQHHRCVVQSYLKWLEDADYDPVCVLCTKSIQEGGDVVRLVCYDVYHVACLDAYGQSLPPNTAPAGYLCPKCKDPLFPPPNMVSPVANRLRQVLQSFSWVASSLGSTAVSQTHINSSLLEGSPDQDTSEVDFLSPMTSTPRAPYRSLPSPDTSITAPPLSAHPPPLSLPHSSQGPANMFEQQSITMARGSGGTIHRESDPIATRLSLGADNDENKYRRKNPCEMVSRWVKQHHHRWHLTMDDSPALMRRYLIMAITAVFLVVMVIVLLTRVGRGVAERDPGLDWRMNPNLRTGD